MTLQDTDSNLEPATLPVPLLSTLETLTPEVLPELPRAVDRRIWDQQQAYLRFYVEYGTAQKACELAGVNRESIRRWRNEDRYGFGDRFDYAIQARREYSEAKYILHRLDNPKGNYGTDLAAIAYMNRIDPENWRPNTKVIIDTGVTKDLLKELRSLGQPHIIDSTATVITEPTVADEPIAGS